MWCLTCGLDTSVLPTVTTAVTESRMADAAELADAAHRAHDGAHEPNWYPGDPMDDITASHYHITITLDPEQGGTRMPSGVAVSDRCFGDEFRHAVGRLIRSMDDLAEGVPPCPIPRGTRCKHDTCPSCVLYRRLIHAQDDLHELPEALLAETGFAITTDFGGGAVVRAGLTRVDAATCSATTS